MAYNRLHTRAFDSYLSANVLFDFRFPCPVCGATVCVVDAANPPAVVRERCPQCKTALYLSLSLTIEWSERKPQDGNRTLNPSDR